MSKDNAVPPPPVSDEEILQMFEGLAKLKAANPAAYDETVKALGLDALAQLMENSSEEGIKDLKLRKNDTKNNQAASNQSLDKITEAIKILRQNQGKTDENEQIKLGNEKQPQGIYITPEAGFSYKTIRISDQCKVFINITMHEAIDQPSMKKKLDDEGNEVEGMNIPMSVGAGRPEKDKKGADSVVYDIVVNPDVIKDIEEDATGKFREFICQLGIQSIEQKYKENLDKRYKIPKLKYMGSTIPRQYIKDRKSMPQIEEVTGKNSSKVATNKKAKAATVEVVPEIEKDLTANMSWVVMESTNEQNIVEEVLSWVHNGKTTSHCTLLPYDYSLVDYIDPIVTPPTNAKGLLLSVELQSYQINLKDVKIAVSPFKLELKIPGYKKMGCYLGASILPNQAKYFIQPVEGFVSTKKLEILLFLDEKEWILDADPGSKQWLIALALSDESDADNAKSTSNPYASRSSNSLSSKNDENRPEFAEDKFHIKLPANVDPYTGLTLNENPMDPDSWDLPEDRFHKKDAASSYLLEQREKTKQEKLEKYEKEKLERANDPNVEYVDMDDFRPGGKYAPAQGAQVPAVQAIEPLMPAEVVKASTVLAEIQKPKLEGVLSSNLWTELLD